MPDCAQCNRPLTKARLRCWRCGACAGCCRCDRGPALDPNRDQAEFHHDPDPED